MEASIKRRTLTIQQLCDGVTKKHDPEVISGLREKLNIEVPNPLGYTIQNSQQKKFDEMLITAVRFAQVLAGQRRFQLSRHFRR